MTANTTHEQRPASGVRASDAERDAVVAELAEHLKDGRLQPDEFDERVGRAVGARTLGDLDALLTDLPRPAQAAPPALPRMRLPVPLVAAAVLVAGMMLLGGIGHAAAAGRHPVWAIWWLWWLIPVAIAVAARRRRRGSSEPAE